MLHRSHHLRSLVKRFLHHSRRLPVRTMGSGRRRYRGRGVSRHRVGMHSTHSASSDALGFLGRHKGKIGAAAVAGIAKLAHHLLSNRAAVPVQGGVGRHRRMTNLPMAY